MKTRTAAPWVALLPMAVVVLVVYAGGFLWTTRVSLSSSASLPVADFVGFAQYARLFTTERWLASLRHGAQFTLLFVVLGMLIGVLLAIAMDRRLRGEVLLRAVFVYPYALSFVAAGLIWQWMFNPTLGLQAAIRALGFADFRLDWIVDPHRALYTILIATLWQSAGIVMAIVLSGLRSIDPTVWHAARVDGIPTWRVYLQVVFPMLAGTFSTAGILLLTIAIKLFDPVVAMTQGGPGLATEVPTKFIMEHLFVRANVGLASAAAVSLTVLAVAVLWPLVWIRRRAVRAGEGAA